MKKFSLLAAAAAMAISGSAHAFIGGYTENTDVDAHFGQLNTFGAGGQFVYDNYNGNARMTTDGVDYINNNVLTGFGWGYRSTTPNRLLGQQGIVPDANIVGNNTSAVTITSPAPNVGFTSDGFFSWSVTNVLSDGPGVGAANVYSLLTFTNKSGVDRVYTFFNQVNPRVVFNDANDRAEVTNDTSSADGIVKALFTQSGSTDYADYLAVGASRIDVGLATSGENIAIKVNGVSGGDYSNDVLGTNITGDTAAGAQWDQISLRNGESITLAVAYGYNTNAFVPEPAALSLLAAGLPLIWRRRRA